MRLGIQGGDISDGIMDGKTGVIAAADRHGFADAKDCLHSASCRDVVTGAVVDVSVRSGCDADLDTRSSHIHCGLHGRIAVESAAATTTRGDIQNARIGLHGGSLPQQ